MSKSLIHTSRGARSDLANMPLPEPSHLSTATENLPIKLSIEELDEEIEVLKSEVNKLQAKIYDLERKRASYAYQISPLRRIPTEILSEIIHLCLCDGEDIIKIASVCGRLREVALGMATVWSKITLQTTIPNENYAESREPIKVLYGSSPEVCFCRFLSLALHSRIG
jgi:uncharacterized small protein (DUF1192 family)